MLSIASAAVLASLAFTASTNAQTTVVVQGTPSHTIPSTLCECRAAFSIMIVRSPFTDEGGLMYEVGAKQRVSLRDNQRICARSAGYQCKFCIHRALVDPI